MALFPIQGIYQDDFVVLLVPIDTEDPMTVVAEKIAHHAAGVRVPPASGELRIKYQGELLDPEATVVDAGVPPLGVLQAVAE